MFTFPSPEYRKCAEDGREILMHQWPTRRVKVSREKCAWVNVYLEAVAAALDKVNLRPAAWLEEIFEIFQQCEATANSFVQYN
jgi:hypothetical protein